MSDTTETKLMIIQNFIDNFTSNEAERLQMYEAAELYVDEDHVDEVECYNNELLGEVIEMYVPDGNPEVWFNKILNLRK